MKKLTSDKKCYLILGIFNIIAFIIFIPISVVFDKWGLTVGWALGFVATFINMVLLFKSGKVVEISAKSEKGVGISVVYYFVRFLLTASMFVICAILDFYLKVHAFKYSLFTCAASVLPSALIILIFYRADIDEDNKKVETK
ncbi:MAG: hypothetical protein MJ213_05935 [Bacilli bacterium]|nr:hypothetical protein [Bacilli bacterium]